MKYFELVTKGTLIVGEDKNFSWETGNLLHQAIDSFYEANAALNLYIKHDDALFDELKSPTSLPPSDDERAQRVEERERLFSEVMAEFGLQPEDVHDINYQIDIKQKRNAWAHGIVPRQIESAEHLIYAKAFVFAFDTIIEALKNLNDSKLVPEKLKELKDEFPSLKGIRNTSHHLGDRVVGLKLVGRKKVQINPEGQNIALNNHGNGAFKTMMEDGTQGSIKITHASLEIMGGILQEILDSYEWFGNKQHFPS